jgi:hypothetical protein
MNMSKFSFRIQGLGLIALALISASAVAQDVVENLTADPHYSVFEPSYGQARRFDSWEELSASTRTLLRTSPDLSSCVTTKICVHGYRGLQSKRNGALANALAILQAMEKLEIRARGGSEWSPLITYALKITRLADDRLYLKLDRERLAALTSAGGVEYRIADEAGESDVYDKDHTTLAASLHPGFDHQFFTGYNKATDGPIFFRTPRMQVNFVAATGEADIDLDGWQLKNHL